MKICLPPLINLVYIVVSKDLMEDGREFALFFRDIERMSIIAICTLQNRGCAYNDAY
jgi:hypothetical protein